jgi:uncharacterized membrane protein
MKSPGEPRMSRRKRVLLWAMAVFYAAAGFNHLMNPDFYLAIMPPGLPDPERLNVIAGLAEIVLGVFVLEPRVRALAAWGIVALLIAVFPANVYVAAQNIGIPGGEPGTGHALLNWVRLPLQGVLVLWAWWYTRPDAAS